MEKIENLEIDVETFVKMYIAVCYTHEQRYFNIENFLSVLAVNNWVDSDIYGEICKAIDDLVGVELEPVEGFENLYQITNDIDYYTILKNNTEYLNHIVKLFYIFNNAEPKYYEDYDMPFDIEFIEKKTK